MYAPAQLIYSTEIESMTVILKDFLIAIIDHDISDIVQHMMDLASKLQDLEFTED
jgi:hypothetical protein